MTVPMIKSIGDVPYPIDTHSDVFSPLLTAGASIGITGDGPTDSAAWLQRVSTADGPTTVKSIHGRTLRWNQLVGSDTSSVTVPSGHKYVARIDGTASYGTSDGTAISVTGGTDNVFDLTAMFGAGNEPSTVAEFEALFPEPYYEYDAGSLLPVNMEDIETVGFNQWDEQTADGYWNDNGTMTVSSTFICCKNKIPVFPGQTYYIQRPSATTNVFMKGYDADGINGISLTLPGTNLLTIPDGVYFITFAVQTAQYGTTYNHDICINLSDPTRNGTYEPYWSQTRSIDVASFFPDGMRGVGDNCDELTETAAITRVGEVDLGTLNWRYSSTNERFTAQFGLVVPNTGVSCTKLTPATYGDVYYRRADNIIAVHNIAQQFEAYASAYTDADAFKAAMSGVMLHYALATPTTTTFDQPLNMTYRTAAGGTERVMVPTGEQSAPPTLVTAQGYTAESLRDAALSAIAPVENGIASTNYAVGSYLVHGGQLCRVTTAIATGEAITIGTNVTTTTVMAEVLSLTQ